jgi:hypothetical protein
MSLNLSADIQTAYDEVRADSNPINWYAGQTKLLDPFLISVL